MSKIFIRLHLIHRAIATTCVNNKWARSISSRKLPKMTGTRFIWCHRLIEMASNALQNLVSWNRAHFHTSFEIVPANLKLLVSAPSSPSFASSFSSVYLRRLHWSTSVSAGSSWSRLFTRSIAAIFDVYVCKNRPVAFHLTFFIAIQSKQINRAPVKTHGAKYSSGSKEIYFQYLPLD